MMQGEKHFCTELPVRGLIKRRDHSLTLYKNYIIIVGGRSRDDNNTDYLVPDVTIVDLNKNTWENATIESKVPFLKKIGHSACLYKGSQIVIFGGKIIGSESAPYDEVGIIFLEKIESQTIEWRVVKEQDRNTFGRAFHTSHIYQDQMYTFGGVCGDRSLYQSNTLFKFNLETYEWMICQTTGKPPKERSSHSSVLYRNKYYVYGGSDGTDSLNDLHVVDLSKTATFEWKELVPKQGFRTGPRGQAHAQLINSEMIIFGGLVPPANHLKDLIGYDIGSIFKMIHKLNLKENNEWRNLSLDGGVTERSGHKSVYYKGQLLIFGGFRTDSIQSISIKQDPTKITEESSTEDLPFHKETCFIHGYDCDYVNHFTGLFLSQKFSDITFVVQNQELPAHKVVLVTRCKYFKNMFTSGMIESCSSMIEIHDASFRTFKALLEYIYCNKTEADEELALEILKLSEKYSFLELKHSCEGFLAKALSLDNFANISNVSEKLEASILSKAVMDFVIKNIRQIEKKKDLDFVPRTLLWQIILKFTSK